MNIAVLLVAGAIAALIMGAFTQLRLAKSVQAARLHLADEGERFLARSDIPPGMRSQVEFFLDSAFGFTGVMIAAVVLFPIAALVMAIFHKRMRRNLLGTGPLAREVRADFIDLMKLHDKIMLANHPVLHTVLNIEVALFSPLYLFVVALKSKTMPDQFEATSLLAYFEMKEAKLFRFGHA